MGFMARTTCCICAISRVSSTMRCLPRAVLAVAGRFFHQARRCVQARKRGHVAEGHMAAKIDMVACAHWTMVRTSSRVMRSMDVADVERRNGLALRVKIFCGGLNDEQTGRLDIRKFSHGQARDAQRVVLGRPVCRRRSGGSKCGPVTQSALASRRRRPVALGGRGGCSRW